MQNLTAHGVRGEAGDFGERVPRVPLGIPNLDVSNFEYLLFAGAMEKVKPNIQNSTRPNRLLTYTEDGSTEALLQILYGQYLILGVFGSCMF